LKDLEKQALEKENQGVGAKKTGQLASLTGAPAFKAGGALPSISDDLAPLGGDKKKLGAGAKFNDQFDDDFSAGSQEDELESPNEAQNEDDEDEDGDFDANELLNLGAYQ